MNKWNISRRIFAGLLSALIFVSALPVTPATAEDQNFGTTADGGYTDGSPLFSSLLTDEDTTPTTSAPEDTTPTTSASENTTPTTSVPEDTTPTTSVPEDTTPTTSTPVDTTPTTPTTSAPADTTPTTPTPTETTPAATTPEETNPTKCRSLPRITQWSPRQWNP